jgi:aromatic ring-opening dioxygenase catalytic subunit (LigB family)
VSLYDNEDPDAHFRLGQAVAPLRDEGVVIIGAGMSVHNLRAMRTAWGNPIPQPWSVSFDEALRDAVISGPVEGRQARMSDLVRRPDARLAHPTFDHLLPVHIAAGAAEEDEAVQVWTMQEASFAWAQYRFGEVPASA